MSGPVRETHDHADLEPAVFGDVRTLELASPATGFLVAGRVSAWIEEVQRWARGQGYLVGHVKVLLESGDEYVRVSGTGGAVEVTASRDWERPRTGLLSVRVAAIIIGPSSSGLGEFAGGALERALAGFQDAGSKGGS